MDEDCYETTTLLIVSIIIFFGCEAEKESGAIKNEANQTTSVADIKGAKRSSAKNETETKQTLNMVAVPVIKKRPCPGLYVSQKNIYCVPVEDTPAIYPRQRGLPCPSDWSPKYEYCVVGPSSTAIIAQTSECAAGWSPQYNHYVAE